jgi:hypothetical protein
MVELQIVILAVAGSSPVGHPARRMRAGKLRGQSAVAQPVLFTISMINPALLEASKAEEIGGDFWLRFLNDEALRHCADLEKIVIGCELIATLDSVELRAA